MQKPEYSCSCELILTLSGIPRPPDQKNARPFFSAGNVFASNKNPGRRISAACISFCITNAAPQSWQLPPCPGSIPLWRLNCRRRFYMPSIFNGQASGALENSTIKAARRSSKTSKSVKSLSVYNMFPRFAINNHLLYL